MPIVACSSPTRSCVTTAIGLPVALAYPWAMPTAIFSCCTSMIAGPSSPAVTSDSCRPRNDAPGLKATYSMPKLQQIDDGVRPVFAAHQRAPGPRTPSRFMISTKTISTMTTSTLAADSSPS